MREQAEDSALVDSSLDLKNEIGPEMIASEQEEL
jgi:hypothetical protein